MKLDVVRSWFSERFPQDTMQAFVQSITAKAMATFATEFVEQLGATEIDWRNPPPL